VPFRRLCRFLPIALALLAACGRRGERAKYVPGSAPEILGIQRADLQTAIATRVSKGTAPTWVTRDRWKRVRDLYATWDNAPLWLEPEGVKDRATALLDALEHAPEHALRTDGYPLDFIRRVITSPKLDSGATAQDVADADVLLTAAYVGYASDMLIGQVDPRSISQAWHIQAKLSVVDSALARALDDTLMAQGLAAMAPQDSEYVLLKSEYRRYQGIVAAGGWPMIDHGVSSDELKTRLEAEGYAVSDPDSVTPSLKFFQERHGLAADGVIGKSTFAALNVPAADRARQIGSNLERHRWLPRSLGSRYVYVNVPSFRLDAYDSGQRVLSMKVVVGAEYKGKATPVFSDSMKAVVFRPYWNITRDIEKAEIAPKIASDPTFLARNDMEYYREAGARFIRQRPGPLNPLGRVKFLFPNDYNIYLHDTNQRELFARSARALSHGCIRVEKPQALTQFVLGWPADSVRQSMDSGADNASVALSLKVPVYIVYFTAYARDGQLYFADDLYKRDDVLKNRVEPIVTDAAPPRDTPPYARAKPLQRLTAVPPA